MYTPVNQHLILKRVSSENTTESGIITTGAENYIVCKACEGADHIQDKVVILNHEPVKLNHEFFVIAYKDVLAFIQ